MAEHSKEQRVYGVFQSISEGYDSANNRISLGLQNSWKKTLTDRLIENTPRGTNILDVCCGTGDIALKWRRVSAADGKMSVSHRAMP